jgi:hypothetical protein
MQLQRKLTAVALVAVAVTASLAFAQVGPVRKGSGGGTSSGQAAAPSGYDNLSMSPMQECLNDMISWKQSNLLHELGGNNVDYNSLSPEVKNARMEIIRACNLYQRAVLNATQQAEYDRTILDPVNHPLPAKWENMRRQGTLVNSLLKATPAQQKQAKTVLDTFRSRNHAIWGRGNDGGYAKNLGLLEKEFRAILNKQQLAEFDKLWSSYLNSVNSAKASATAGA